MTTTTTTTNRDDRPWSCSCCWPCTRGIRTILLLHLLAMMGFFINYGFELQSIRNIMQPQLRANSSSHSGAVATSKEGGGGAEKEEFQNKSSSTPPSPCNSSGGGAAAAAEPRPTILLPETQDGKLIQGLRRDLTNATYEKLFSSSSATCLPTTQVQIIFPTNNNNNNNNERCNDNASGDDHDNFYWELQTFDEYGHPKTVGGDEFYVTYTDQRLYESQMINNNNSTSTTKAFHKLPFTAAAWITDLHNGRYRLEFEEPPPPQPRPRRIILQQNETGEPVSPPLAVVVGAADRREESAGISGGNGVLAVYFQYTCQIGRMGPPSKQRWKTGGNTADIWYKTKNKVLPMAPPIRPFQYPLSIIGQPSGEDGLPKYWKDNFDVIVPVGDSLLMQFLEPLGIQFPNINQHLSMANVKNWMKVLDDRIREKQTKFVQEERMAIITDSCVWDILDDDVPNTTFTRTTTTTTTTTATLDGSNSSREDDDEEEEWVDHRLAMEEYLRYISEKVPKATIFWKSCTGMHIQLPALQEGKPGTSRVKYMSTSRAWSLYSIQKEVIEKEIEKRGKKEQQEAAEEEGSSSLPRTTRTRTKQRLFFLDVYSAYYLSPNRAQEGDGRHYIPDLNREVVSWFATNASSSSSSPPPTISS